ncbi:unnamed protein product [Mytilus coruscus]|uniref:Uncharacterized protein n=1 Tax=Mytilus coruscus TaxID=42192 RepID=A0A6J8CG25_MYTCO|nr:unnamed protein product [Mytilus coruscus]
MLNTVRDNLSYDNDMATITSGSRGEGIEMQGSDLDIMRPIRYIETADGVLPTCNFKKGIHRLFSSKSSKIRYLYSYYLSKFCYKSKHFVQFNDKSGNKNMYRQSNACVSTLLRGMGHDAVSGWLMLASFFYRTNQYDKALNIIEHSLLKCSPEKLFQYKHLSHVQSEFLSLHLFKKMNIVKLWKFLILDYVIFAKNSEIIATELQIDVKKTEYLIPPVQFAHFLRFLCHYNLHNTTQLLESTRNLQRAIQEDYFLALYIERAVCYNMLGISFQMAGDTDSARLAFINSIVNDPDEYCNTAFHRLSLIR